MLGLENRVFAKLHPTIRVAHFIAAAALEISGFHYIDLDGDVFYIIVGSQLHLPWIIYTYFLGLQTRSVGC